MNAVALDAEELGVLRHALGLSESVRVTPYRSHFVTGPGSADHDTCRSLVRKGYMMRRAPSALTGGNDLFLVTDAGRSAALAFASPRLTRSQRRYMAFLDADCGMRFGEWLKSSPRP